MNDAPAVGELARDTKRDRIGVVMGNEGGLYQLRPPGGGLEWDVRPVNVERATQDQLLRARVRDTNRRSREGRQAMNSNADRSRAETSPPQSHTASVAGDMTSVRITGTDANPLENGASSA
ncbi:hypothetical protein HUT18_05555 [Streptomyces sp. NA04227]|uniref:hypothetical protein n=1 Tax=Streptomyces sp. NA04227 TaxID=2742136 RepID=UPI00159096DA|nr:hypothetical protein [Streptomyces sp. NA04227]QKW05936.1 hypothetical protein HUT18_05555 [Streptomyces sp. NA04227]